MTYSSIQSFFVRAKAQLHAKAIVKTLPAFPFQTLSFSKPESSISADQKTDFSELKTWEVLLILWYLHQILIYFVFEKCTSSQPQLIHTLSKAESVPFSVSSWDSGLKAAWTCITAWKPGKSGVSNWPTFLSQFLRLDRKSASLEAASQNPLASLCALREPQCWVENNKLARCSDKGCPGRQIAQAGEFVWRARLDTRWDLVPVRMLLAFLQDVYETKSNGATQAFLCNIRLDLQNKYC